MSVNKFEFICFPFEFCLGCVGLFIIESTGTIEIVAVSTGVGLCIIESIDMYDIGILNA